jgi:acyl transferase domain-containing protein
MNADRDELMTGGIAIVGMAGRFPGARDLDTFWRNICAGAESISMFSDEEIDAFGLDPQSLKNPAYIKARGIIDDVELFDPGFFGYGARDALLMDPQHRLFLEACWEALERAGYDPRLYKGLVGVYGGATSSSYQSYLYAHLDLLPNPDPMSIAIANELPFLTTRVSYKLDLKGPSCPVQTACSTSLVAVHLACQGLLNAECDMALAGGVSLRVPQKTGYWYQEENILSADGHCRSFDANAAGTVFSNGLGVVVLKRLEDAIDDGDTVYAVIRGSAINNDGARRASFTAPGVYGQSQVIADAMAAGGVDPDTISYIEAHGTATSLGDSIEIQALNKAFARGTSRKQYCAIGTVKANIGHLDAAAGVAGLIKTVLMLRNKQVPPAAMFERPNPDLQLETTPFFVNTQLTDWLTSDGVPRRAGVSSFGFGGTNAHLVIEEAPPADPTTSSREYQVLMMSAESSDGLERTTTALAAHLGAHPETDLADAAYTLQTGRRAFRNRRAVVCRTREEARALLESRDSRVVFSGTHDAHDRPVVFMFPGQGSQHVAMGRGLYDAEPAFRACVDECADLLKPVLGEDIRALMFPDGGATPEATERLTRTAHAQPALFVIEYALARLWMSWGVQPDAMIGHSVGEWVAACLSGVVSLADALRLVALRGRLMEEMPVGVMLAVPLPETTVRRMLPPDVWLAAINAPSMCVVSGTAEAIDRFAEALQADGVEGQRLQTSHAFHSGLMDAAVPQFVAAVAQAPLAKPSSPFISNLTGTWITEADATSAAYWGRQIREAVRFADGAAELLRNDQRVFLEVGPGQALTTLMRRQAGPAVQRLVPSLRRPQEQTPDGATIGAAIGRLWVAGVKLDWKAFYADERRRRIALPTYAFDRQRFWVSRPRSAAPKAAARAAKNTGRLPQVGDWLYTPTWTRQASVRPADKTLGDPANWLVFADAHGVSDACVSRLEDAGHHVAVVTPGTRFDRTSDVRFTIDPFSRADYDRVVGELMASGRVPAFVLHGWGVGDDPADQHAPIVMTREDHVTFWSLTLLAAALADANVNSPVRIATVTTGAYEITGDERLSPGKATAIGLGRVIPQEHPNFTCRSIDLPSADGVPAVTPRGVNELLREVMSNAADAVVAYRGGHRWVQRFAPISLPAPETAPARLRQKGVYLITGGLGDIALNMAEYLARTVQARLVLTGRTLMPDEATWDEYVRTRGPRDITSQRIARLRRVQSLGGEVLLVQADAADTSQMAAAFARADERFGAVHGVIHAAGLVTGDAFRSILQTDEDIVRRQFQPKVEGLRVLDDVMRGRALDFCMLVSSLSSILGGLGYGAYAAANAFMDAFAYRRNRTSGVPWITVNWDGWVRAEDEAALHQAGKAPTGYVMTGREGMDAFARILSHEAGVQVAVSTGDLQVRVDQWVRLAAAVEETREEEKAESSARMPRPNLQTEFVAPRTDLERTLASVWQQMLGLDRVGVNDSFFELGGDSLLGIQVIARIKRELGVKISAVTLYEGPTVGSLAAVIETTQAPAGATAAFDASRQRGERRREKKLKALASTEPESLGA